MRAVYNGVYFTSPTRMRFGDAHFKFISLAKLRELIKKNNI